MSSASGLAVSIDANPTASEPAIVIRLPLSTMVSAAEQAPFIHTQDPQSHGRFRITDAQRFAEEVMRALEDDPHAGGSLIENAFDDAFESVVDNGGDGFEWPAAQALTDALRSVRT